MGGGPNCDNGERLGDGDRLLIGGEPNLLKGGERYCSLGDGDLLFIAGEANLCCGERLGDGELLPFGGEPNLRNGDRRLGERNLGGATIRGGLCAHDLGEGLLRRSDGDLDLGRSISNAGGNDPTGRSMPKLALGENPAIGPLGGDPKRCGAMSKLPRGGDLFGGDLGRTSPGMKLKFSGTKSDGRGGRLWDRLRSE